MSIKNRGKVRLQVSSMFVFYFPLVSVVCEAWI